MAAPVARCHEILAREGRTLEGAAEDGNIYGVQSRAVTVQSTP